MLRSLLNTFLLISSIALLGVLFGSSSVNAQSAYDDLINPVDELLLKDRYGNHEINATFSLGSIIQEQCNTNQYNFFNNVVSNYDNGARWAIVNNFDTRDGPTFQSISIRFITNSNDGVTYDNTSTPYFYTSSSGNKYLRYLRSDTLSSTLEIQITSDGNYHCNYTSDNSLQSIAEINAYNNAYTVRPFINNFYIEYPDGYNGEPIRDELPIEGPTEKIGVSIRGSVVEDVISVEWYHDPDNPPPVEAKGIYLVLHNTNFDENPPECSNQNIQEWRHSLEAIAVFDPVPCYGFWYVQSYYTSDVEGQNIINNTDKTSLNLRVDGGSFYFDYADVEYEDDGTIISPPLAGIAMSDCVVFIESMPWIEFNYQGCFTNIQKFIGIGSTNHIHVSRQFQNITIPAHQGCGSLTKVNEWIGLDDTNNYLCPQITPEIRQYITLFAVFLLYIAIIFGWYKFMTREY